MMLVGFYMCLFVDAMRILIYALVIDVGAFAIVHDDYCMVNMAVKS